MDGYSSACEPSPWLPSPHLRQVSARGTTHPHPEPFPADATCDSDDEVERQVAAVVLEGLSTETSMPQLMRIQTTPASDPRAPAGTSGAPGESEQRSSNSAAKSSASRKRARASGAHPQRDEYPHGTDAEATGARAIGFAPMVARDIGFAPIDQKACDVVTPLELLAAGAARVTSAQGPADSVQDTGGGHVWTTAAKELPTSTAPQAMLPPHSALAPMSPLVARACLGILGLLERLETRHSGSGLLVKLAGPFLYPVALLVADLPDYCKIVAHPIDLLMIRAKLKCVPPSYASATAFSADVMLMVGNCVLYNKTPLSQGFADGAKLLWSKFTVLFSTVFGASSLCTHPAAGADTPAAASVAALAGPAYLDASSPELPVPCLALVMQTPMPWKPTVIATALGDGSALGASSGGLPHTLLSPGYRTEGAPPLNRPAQLSRDPRRSNFPPREDGGARPHASDDDATAAHQMAQCVAQSKAALQQRRLALEQRAQEVAAQARSLEQDEATFENQQRRVMAVEGLMEARRALGSAEDALEAAKDDVAAVIELGAAAALRASVGRANYGRIEDGLRKLVSALEKELGEAQAQVAADDALVSECAPIVGCRSVVARVAAEAAAADTVRLRAAVGVALRQVEENHALAESREIG